MKTYRNERGTKEVLTHIKDGTVTLYFNQLTITGPENNRSESSDNLMTKTYSERSKKLIIKSIESWIN